MMVRKSEETIVTLQTTIITIKTEEEALTITMIISMSPKLRSLHNNKRRLSLRTKRREITIALAALKNQIQRMRSRLK